MSSVGSSDSSSSSSSNTQNDVIRRNREDAQKTESELVKKHQKEIRRINEEHYAEMENLKKAHDAQIADLRKVSHEDVNERDHKYQQEIEDMRDLYKKQLQSQADETSRRDDAVKLAKTVDNGSEKAQSESRLKKLGEDYQKNLTANQKTNEEATKQSREAERNAIMENRDKLTKHYQEENQILSDDRKNQVDGLQKDYGDYRQTTQAQLRDQELRHMQEKQRDSDNLLRAVNKERTAASDSNEYLREGFKDGLAKTRERYDKTYNRDRAAADAARQQNKDSIGDRIESQVNRLKSEKADLQDGKVRSELQMKQKQQREIADIADTYQKNMDNYRDQRDAAVTSNTERVHKSVEKVRKEMGDQAVEQNRFYRSEEDLQNRIHRQAYDSLKGDYDIRNEQAKNLADTRVKNIYETTAEEKARIAGQESENHTASQRSHQDDMVALRSALESDKQTAVTSLTERLQKQELQHGERMAAVVGKYEKQIQTLKDQMVREKRQGDENMKRAVEEMQRSHKTSLDQLEAQNRDRMHQADALHAEELRNQNKRNDEKINQVLNEVKKT